MRHSFAAWLSTFSILKFEVPSVNFTAMSFDREMFTSNVLKMDEVTKASLARQADALLEKISQLS